MIVPVQDHFHAVALQQRQQIGRIGQTLVAGSRTERMVNEEDAKHRFAGKSSEQALERSDFAPPRSIEDVLEIDRATRLRIDTLMTEACH